MSSINGNLDSDDGCFHCHSKQPTNKSKTKQKTNKRRSARDSQNFDTGLVPLKTDVMTDRLLFPKRTDQVITTTKTYAIEAVITQATASYVSWSPTLYANQIADITSLAAVFDQYKINMIEVVLKPRGNAVAPNTSSGQLYSVIDYDDNNLLSNATTAVAYANCITTEYYQPNRRCFRPRIAMAAYGSGTFGSYANIVAPWIDMNSLTVVHYGVKFVADPGTTPFQTWDATIRYDISFRATR
jgi:hypothetical protein